MANFYGDDPANEIFFKYIAVPVFVLIIIGNFLDFSNYEPDYGNYEWSTYEERHKTELQKERKWARDNGVEWKLDSRRKLKSKADYGSNNCVDDLENAEPQTSLFREYMEELDNRDIEPGSPWAVEIWETYY